MTTIYDQVLYPNRPRAQTHPLRLSALASLHGAPSTAFGACRVLEVGCGDGGNLVPMALAAPNAEFVGIDLAPLPIEQGRQMAAALGLTNLRLEARDICAPNGDLGTFDYLIAHGVYAWTPAPVRAALMALAGRVLSPTGLAFISYNAFPGCRIRQVVRDLLLGESDVCAGGWRDRVTAARRHLERFIELWTAEENPFRRAVADESRLLLKKPDAVIFHDELADVYEPQSLGAIAAAAAAEGLSYLCDVQAGASDAGPAAILRELSGSDPLRFEQLEDFAILRRFRQSIFQRAGVGRLAEGFDLDALAGLWACAKLTPADPKALESGAIGFVTANGHSLESANPDVADLLGGLSRAYPAAVMLEPYMAKGEAVRQAVVGMVEHNLLTLQAESYPLTLAPGPRPGAGRLARWQAASGQTELWGLNHETVHVPDPTSLRFLSLLDGQRDRADLAAAMGGAATPETLAEVERGLLGLARLGLMEC